MNESACNFQVVPTNNVFYPIGGSVIQGTRFANESKLFKVFCTQTTSTIETQLVATSSTYRFLLTISDSNQVNQKLIVK